MKITDNKFLLLFSATLLLWLFAFSDSIIAMEAIWRRSDTFAHGYFILPIVIWLVWQRRQVLKEEYVTTSNIALLGLISSIGLWLVSVIADINVTSQLAAVLALIFLIWSLVGNRIAGYFKFPLTYLLFLVPMGESLIPWLQDVTAWITVFLLNIHGIPVFRDGLYLQTPTGLFEVAVACSGIRYLIASFAVGTLFGYLNYNSYRKQIIFALFALILPIIANGMRAYGIVIIAHYSDMKYATGADHLVYGWLFFGVVIFLMFWIGGKFSDIREYPIYKPKEQPKKYRKTTPIINILAITSSYLLFILIPQVSPPSQPDALLVGKPITTSDWGITFSKSLGKSHVIEGQFEYFVASYANTQSDGELISFENSLHNKDNWTIVEREAFKQNDQHFVYIGLRSSEGNVRSYLYSYVIGTQSTGSDSLAKLYQVWQTLIMSSNVSYVKAVSHKPELLDEKDKNELLLAFSSKHLFNKIK